MTLSPQQFIYPYLSRPKPYENDSDITHHVHRIIDLYKTQTTVNLIFIIYTNFAITD